MKVREMIELLGTSDPEANVVIVVEGSSFGATPCVEISDRIVNGFDWDAGRVLIRTKQKIRKDAKQ